MVAPPHLWYHCVMTRYNNRATATIVATSWTELYQLCKPDFDTIVKDYPQVRSALESVAQLRLMRTPQVCTCPNTQTTLSPPPLG